MSRVGTGEVWISVLQSFGEIAMTYSFSDCKVRVQWKQGKVLSTSVNHIASNLVEGPQNVFSSSGLTWISSHLKAQHNLKSCLGSPGVSSSCFVLCWVICVCKCLHKHMSFGDSITGTRNTGCFKFHTWDIMWCIWYFCIKYGELGWLSSETLSVVQDRWWVVNRYLRAVKGPISEAVKGPSV